MSQSVTDQWGISHVELQAGSILARSRTEGEDKTRKVPTEQQHHHLEKISLLQGIISILE